MVCDLCQDVSKLLRCCVDTEAVEAEPRQKGRQLIFVQGVALFVGQQVVRSSGVRVTVEVPDPDPFYVGWNTVFGLLLLLFLCFRIYVFYCCEYSYPPPYDGDFYYDSNEFFRTINSVVLVPLCSSSSSSKSSSSSIYKTDLAETHPEPFPQHCSCMPRQTSASSTWWKVAMLSAPRLVLGLRFRV